MATVNPVAGPSRRHDHHPPQQPPPPPQQQQPERAPLAIVQDLIQSVTRGFYERRHIVLLDQLMRKEAMKEEELAGRLGVGAKDLLKMSHLLVQHQLLQVHKRNEIMQGSRKASSRMYYYIDYRHVVDVIKWRMWKLQKLLDEKSRTVMGGQGYVCPKCSKAYSTLDVGSLQIVVEGFLCEICGTVIVDNDNAEEVVRNKDRMQRFNQQSARIKSGLQKADKVRIPPFEIARWLADHAPLDNAVGGDGLAVATGGARESAVTVSMAKEGDEAAKRRAREEEAEAKRKANALPVWIAQSTITGDPTKGAAPDPLVERIPSSPTRPDVKPDVKPKTTEADLDADLDAYFAAQQDEGDAPALGQPGLTRSTSIASSSNGSASLTGSSVVLKRSREKDEGYASLENLHELGALDPDESEVRYGKKPKRSPGSSPVTTLADPILVADEEDEDDEDEDEDEVEAVGRDAGGDERQVMCGGKLVLLRDVTDEMAETLMTEEEYTRYVDLM